MALMNNISNNWASVISDIANRPAVNKIWSVIQRLVFGAAIYFLWQERNFRCYQQKEREVEFLFDHIVETVRMKIRGFTLKHTLDVMKASRIWNFPVSKNIYHMDIVRKLINLNGE